MVLGKWLCKYLNINSRDGPVLQLVLDVSVKKPQTNCWAEGIGGTSGSLEEKRQMQRGETEFLLVEKS